MFVAAQKEYSEAKLMFFATQVKSNFSLLWKRKNGGKKNIRDKALVWVPSKLFSEFVMETETILRPNTTFDLQRCNCLPSSYLECFA